jgi:hypothetical protein
VLDLHKPTAGSTDMPILIILKNTKINGVLGTLWLLVIGLVGLTMYGIVLF